MLVLSVVSSRFPYMSSLISGGYSDGAPPLPIPNREVKPVRADGTASSGRVGSRRFFPEESGIPHNVECRISCLYNPHEGRFWLPRQTRERDSTNQKKSCKGDAKSDARAKSFRLVGLTFEKTNPEVQFYGASGRVFMLFGVLPDSNISDAFH